MEKPIKPSPGRLTAALFLPMAVLAAAYYAADGKLGDWGGEAFRLTADAPSGIALRQGDATPFEIKLALTNRTGDPSYLTASDPCKVLRWSVQAPGDVFVQSKGDACTPEEISRHIASGETIERTETISLDSKRYKPGVTYTVFVQFYGQQATTRFEVSE